MRIFKMCLSFVLMGALFLCATNGYAAKKVLLAVYFDNPDYKTARNTFRAELTKAAAREGLDIEFMELNTNRDKEAFITRLKELEPEVDLIFTTGTPNAMAVKQAGITKPVVFSAVANPVGAKLVKSLDRPGTNFTGNYCAVSASNQLRALLLTLPSVKKIGILYNPDDPAPTSQAKGWRKAVKDAGLELEEFFIPKETSSAADLAEATKQAVGKVDVLVTTADAKVSPYGEGWIDACIENKIPTYATLAQLVRKGALLSLGYNFAEGAKMNVSQAMDILKGKSPKDIACNTFREYQLLINMSTAKKIGVSIPLRALRTASEIIK